MTSKQIKAALDARDFTRAVPLLRSEAEAGDAESQFRLADLCMFGVGVELNEAEAKRWFRKAMEQGHDKAQFRLAMLLIGDGGKPEDAAEGLRLLTAVAESGHEMAQHNLGEYLVERGDVDEGLAWLKRVAERGSDLYAAGDSAIRLGELFREGKQVVKDGAEAIRWLKRAVEVGQDCAAYDIARIHYDGDGVERNFAEAAKWFRRAAEMGYDDSIYRLGQMHLAGEGVPADKAEAARIFCRGADMLDPDCMNAFAALFREGVVVGDAECKIAKWYRKAIDEDDRDLQRYLGLRRDYLNRSSAATLGGLLALVALIWADWRLIADHVTPPTGKASWIHVALLVLAGAYLSGWMSRFGYQAHRYLQIRGFPFPVVVFEPQSLGSDLWLDFEGPQTLVSPVLNAVLACALLVAICLSLPAGMLTPFVFIVLAVAGWKARNDEWRREKGAVD